MEKIPKDILIKLILEIEKTITTSLKLSYQEVYDRQNEIYESSDSMFLRGHWVLVDRCNFPGCTEYQVFWNMKESRLLNSCRWGCTNGGYYCDAHDKLHYIKDIEHGDFSVCENCLPKVLKRGLTITEKNMSHVDKDKVKKQLAKDDANLRRKQNKIPTYYTMSRQQLIHKLVNIGNETRRKCEKGHQKELLLFEDIMTTIHNFAEQSKE